MKRILAAILLALAVFGISGCSLPEEALQTVSEEVFSTEVLPSEEPIEAPTVPPAEAPTQPPTKPPAGVRESSD